MTAAHIRRRHPRFLLLQHSDHLFLAKPAPLHIVRLLVRAGRSLSLEKIQGRRPTANADLREVFFTKKPEGWLGKDIEKAEYRVKWCAQHGKLDCPYAPDPLQGKSGSQKDSKEFECARTKHWKERLDVFEKKLIYELQI